MLRKCTRLFCVDRICLDIVCDLFYESADGNRIIPDKRVAYGASCDAQLFSHFVHDAYEYDDDYETRVFREAMKLKGELGEVFEEYMIWALSPDHWEKQEVEVPPCDLKGLKEG